MLDPAPAAGCGPAAVAMKSLCNVFGAMGAEGFAGRRPNLDGILSMAPRAIGVADMCDPTCQMPCAEMVDYAGQDSRTFTRLCNASLAGASMRNLLRYRSRKYLNFPAMLLTALQENRVQLRRLAVDLGVVGNLATTATAHPLFLTSFARLLRIVYE